MKWAYRKSRLKRWIDRHREESWQNQVVMALWPLKVGCGAAGTIYWLCPVNRTREHTSWKPRSCLDSGYTSWWSYSAPLPGDWSEWIRRRPMHHLAGLVYVLVYWAWYPGLIVGLGLLI